MGHDGLSVTSIADARLHGEILQHTVAFVLGVVTFLTRSNDIPKFLEALLQV